MRWTAVLNPAAGRGRTLRLRGAIEAALSPRGIAVEVPASAAATVDAAAAAFGRGEGVIVCGGDGTVAAVAGVAATCGGTVAVVPTGAGTDFARHLGIASRRPLDAVALLDSGRVARCDLGRATVADGAVAWFTTVANVGFDGEANRWANGVRWATGTPLYVLALLRTLATYRPVPLLVAVDGEAREVEAWLAAVANGRYYAGGMMIAPGAEVDDGCLDVCVVGPVSRAEFLLRFPRVFRGTHTAVPEVETGRGRVVELDAAGAGPRLQLWASGELVGPLPARLEARPGALRVLVPDRAPVTAR
jgi:YegS/Rv2252/BmrU family lipid kinase